MENQVWTCSAGHPNLKIDKFCISVPRCSTGDGMTTRQGHEYVANPYDESDYPECVCITCDPDQQYLIIWCEFCGDGWDRREAHECDINQVHSYGGHEDAGMECLGCEEDHDQHRITHSDFEPAIDAWIHGKLSKCKYSTCTDEREMYEFEQSLKR